MVELQGTFQLTNCEQKTYLLRATGVFQAIVGGVIWNITPDLIALEGINPTGKSIIYAPAFASLPSPEDLFLFFGSAEFGDFRRLPNINQLTVRASLRSSVSYGN